MVALSKSGICFKAEQLRVGVVEVARGGDTVVIEVLDFRKVFQMLQRIPRLISYIWTVRRARHIYVVVINAPCNKMVIWTKLKHEAYAIFEATNCALSTTMELIRDDIDAMDAATTLINMSQYSNGNISM